jgi:hypothetical protein
MKTGILGLSPKCFFADEVTAFDATTFYKELK